MSLRTFSSSLLTLGPSIGNEGGVLRLRTPRLLRVLSLGSFCRTVEVDSRRRRVRFLTRRLWAFTAERSLGFEEVDHLDYEYASLATEWSWWHGPTDEIDRYTVSLVLKGTGEKIPLATYHGEGAICTGWEGVIFSDDSPIDGQGTQDEQSLSLVEALRRILGVPLGKQIGPIRDGDGHLWRCRGCGRHGPPRRPTCQYCGAAASPEGQA